MRRGKITVATCRNIFERRSADLPRLKLRFESGGSEVVYIFTPG